MRKTISQELNKIALPLIIQSVSNIIIGLTDQAMVGRISVSAFSAVGVVVSLLYVMAGVIGSISVVFNIRGGKAMGEGNEQEFEDEFASSVFLNALIGILFFFITVFLKRPILTIIYGFSGEILSEAITYFNIMSVYMILQLLLFNFGTYFKIIMKTKWIMIGSTASALINLLLDYIFIFGKFGFPRMGVKAAAISTIAALFLNLAFYIWICRKAFKFRMERLGIYMKKAVCYFKDSVSLMGQEILEGSIFVIGVNAVVARIGSVELPAYLILVQLINLPLMPTYMYGQAALTLISRNLGTGGKRSSDISKWGTIISFLIFSAVCLAFILLRNFLPGIITEDKIVASTAAGYMIFMILAHLLNPVTILYRYSLQSIGQGRFVLFESAKINTIALLIMILSVFWLRIGVHGILLGLFVNYTVMAISFYKKYTRLL